MKKEIKGFEPNDMLNQKKRESKKFSMNKKPFYKCWWFWLLAIGVLLFLAGNILVLIYVNCYEKNSWLTLISGWVSGVATLIVGLIAYNQSKQHIDVNYNFNRVFRFFYVK